MLFRSTLIYISFYCLVATGMYKDNVMPASGSKVKSLFGGLSKKADDSSSSSDDEQYHGGKLCHENRVNDLKETCVKYIVAYEFCVPVPLKKNFVFVID